MSLSGKMKETTGEENIATGDGTFTKDKQLESETKKEETANKENTQDKPKEDGRIDETEGKKGQADNEQNMEEGQDTVTVDLSSMKSLYQFRSRPTLPFLLTEYGMEDKGAPPMKPRHNEKKKKKHRTFGDDSGRDKEKEKLTEERQLQVLEDMKKLRDYYYDEYTTLLQNRVGQQRHDIRQHSRMMQNKLSQQEEKARQETHRVKHRLERHTLLSDDSFLQDLPKTDLFYIIQLQDKLVREGVLKSQTDFDIFWQRIQQPDVFYMYFKVPKSDNPIIHEDFNENASSKGALMWKGSNTANHQRSATDGPSCTTTPLSRGGLGPKALSFISESQESSRPGTRGGKHWAVTQQFPPQHREQRENRRTSFTGLKQSTVMTKSSYLQELEKRFPKLEMPKLHCFSMSLGPKAPDPEEVRHQRNLHSLEKNRKKYSYKLNKMHQLAMANAAAASRILEMHEDVDFIINGSHLKDLISDQYFYSGLHPPLSPPPHQPGEEGALVASSNPLLERDPGQQYMLPSVMGQEREAFHITSYKSSNKTPSGKSRGSRKASGPESVEPTKPTPIPLSMSEVTETTQILEAKCLSTLWINYMKDAPAAQT